MEARPRVGVSSCLLGEEVRFNGGHKRYRFLTDDLGPYVEWVPYCPEVSMGLGTPREPIRLTAGGRLVNRSGTADHTDAMEALPLPDPDLDGYVFKAKSPSCGIRAIPRYRPDGTVADHGPENSSRSRAVAKIRSQNASRSPASFSRPSSSTASSGNAVSTRSAYSPRPSWPAARPSWP